jgi:uncharacterized protein involved in response to NO
VNRARFSLFAYGFRPFFLAAGAYALVALAAWLWIYGNGGSVGVGMAPQHWHGHEMLFGFIGAAIGGFLLTAVPSWTGARGFAGRPLILVCLAWLAGRVAFLGAAWIPLPLLAVAELIFLPSLIALVAPPLLRERNRNTPLLIVLMVLWATNVAFIVALARMDVVLASAALRTGINVVLLLVTVIGGRIVPSFTANALRAKGKAVAMRRIAWLEYAVIGLMAAIIVVDVVMPFSRTAAVVAGLAAIAQAVRMLGWQGHHTLNEPIVWVLHAAYVWLPIGLALKCIALLTGADWAAHWLHALTIGVAAMMILAVMTRASLGHTGRPLRVAGSIAMAYGLLILAVTVRVFGPVIAPSAYLETVLTAGICWLLAFGIYVVVYAPILARPRADGRPG